MKFISLIDNYRSALAIAERAVGKSSHLPILGHFLIETNSNKISLSATNLDIAVVTEFAGKVEETGKATIPAKTLLAFLSQITEGKLEVVSSGKNLTVKTEHYRSTFQGLDPDEFPLIPKVAQKEAISIESSRLKTALLQVIPAAGTSDIRPELASVLFHYEPGGNLTLVATDSFRLAEKTIPAREFSSSLQSKARKLIPLRSAEEVLRISQEKTGEVKIFLDENQALFSWPDTKLVSRLLEGEFPDYAGILPKAFAAEILTDRKQLAEGLRVSGVFASKLNDVRVAASPGENKVVLRAADAAVGENEAEIPAEVSGKPAEVSFNFRYLIDGLEQLTTPRAFFGLQDASSPALLRGEGDPSYLYVVMPIRL